MYEITFITKEEESAKIVKDMLTKIEAKIEFDYPMGRKNFAYPIQKENAGYYYTYFFNTSPEEIEKLNRDLKTERKILRYLIVKNNENLEVIKERVIKIKKENKKPRNLEKVAYKPIEKEMYPEITKKAVKKVEEKITETEEPKKEIEKIAKKTKKTVSKKTTKKTETETKPTDKTEKVDKETDTKAKNEEERIKKLEEKLDELLNE